jgi:hypothetical protein
MTLEDMGIPSHLSGHEHGGAFDVRASRIEIRGRRLRSELWIGGGYTAVGEPVAVTDLAGAWVVDCAGELPGEFASMARLYIPRVFEDIEQTPAGYPAIQALARRLAAALDASVPPLPVTQDEAAPHLPVEAPARLYVMCKQGLNRSGLVLGRIMRELGLSGEQAVGTLRAQRPGSLANLAFERLLHD